MCVGKVAIQVPIETLQRTICPTDQDDRKVKQGDWVTTKCSNPLKEPIKRKKDSYT